MVVDAVSDNDDSDSEDMLVAMERQEQVAGAGSLWSCTVCTVSIGVVLFSSFYFKCLTFVLFIHEIAAPFIRPLISTALPCRFFHHALASIWAASQRHRSHALQRMWLSVSGRESEAGM